MRQPRTTRHDLARLLAGWLIAILALQTLAAAQAGVRGPQHHHGPAGFDLPHFHDGSARHHHAVFDVTAQPEGTDAALDAAAAPLLIALAALLGGFGWRAGTPLRHVWSAGRCWTPSARSPVPPRRPPR